MTRWHAVAPLSDLREDEIYPANVDGIDLIVLRFEGGVAAFLDACPYEGAQLSFGERDGDVLICAKHLREFDVRTGEHISRVHRAERDLRKCEVRTVNGVVEIDLSGLAAPR
jgi:3-phenylpropionate/trans-cinnamate dioxygenase ferredoxin subunit